MFKRLETGAARRIGIIFDGVDVAAVEGESVAAALLAGGISTLRQSAVSGHPRAPYCMMGACFECLVEIEGRVVQACMISARDGMNVRRPVWVQPESAAGDAQ